MRKKIAIIMAFVLMFVFMMPVSASAVSMKKPVVTFTTGQQNLVIKSSKVGTKYYFYESDSKKGKFKKIGTSKNNYYKIPLPTKSKYYKIKAVKGKKSATSKVYKSPSIKKMVYIGYVAYTNKYKNYAVHMNLADKNCEYRIYRSNYENGYFKYMGSTNRIFVDKKADPHQLYYYKVRVYNKKTKSYSNLSPARKTPVNSDFTNWKYNGKNTKITINRYNKKTKNGKMVYWVAQVKGKPSNYFANNSLEKAKTDKQTISKMMRINGGLFAVNADASGFRDYAARKPFKFSNGKAVTAYNTQASGIQGCQTKNNKFILVDGKNYKSNKEISNLGVTDSWNFGCTLISAGKVANLNPNQDLNPLTAMGQKKDGTWIFIVIDGRGSNGSIGATYYQMAQLMNKYRAYNAIELDGGGSSEMWFGNVPLNFPSDGAERLLDSCIYVKE